MQVIISEQWSGGDYSYWNWGANKDVLLSEEQNKAFKEGTCSSGYCPRLKAPELAKVLKDPVVLTFERIPCYNYNEARSVSQYRDGLVYSPEESTVTNPFPWVDDISGQERIKAAITHLANGEITPKDLGIRFISSEEIIKQAHEKGWPERLRNPYDHGDWGSDDPVKRDLYEAFNRIKTENLPPEKALSLLEETYQTIANSIYLPDLPELSAKHHDMGDIEDLLD